MLSERVWAEVVVNGEHLRLFSEHNAQGVRTSVYNVSTKTWIAPSEPVGDIEEGKDRAAECARAYLKHALNAELPPLEWKKARSRRPSHAPSQVSRWCLLLHRSRLTPL